MSVDVTTPAEALRTAVLALADLRLDTNTDPAELAADIPGAVESCRILDARLAGVVAAAEAEARAAVLAEIAQLNSEARALQDEAAADAVTTAATVNALYSRQIVGAGVMTVAGEALLAQATAKLNQADTKQTSLRAPFFLRTASTPTPVSVAEITALSAAQFVQRSAAITAAVVAGQVEA